MSMKTDTRTSAGEISLWSLLTTLGCSIGLLLILAYNTGIQTEPGVDPGLQRQMLMHSQFPQVVAGGLTIQSGLEEFSGGKAKPMGARMAANLALGFLLSYVVGPVLLFGWIRRRLLGERAQLPRVSTVMGLLLAGLWMLLAAPIFMIQLQVRGSLRLAQSNQGAKDDMINALTTVANDAKQHRILPKRLGGGEGSFDGFTVPATFTGKDTLGVNSQPVYDNRLMRFPVRITATVGANEIRLLAVPLVNPRSRFTGEPLQPVPEASVATTLYSDGYMRGWTYTGEFQ